MKPALRQQVIAGLASLVLAACGDRAEEDSAAGKSAEFVVVYTSVDEQRLLPVYKAFTANSGIRIQQVTSGDDTLLQWMLDTKRTPAADLYLAEGAFRLWHATRENVFRPVYVDSIEEAVPEKLRDPDKQWFGIAVTANAIVFNIAATSADAPSTYESLADEAWKGRICLSTSARVENIALVASLIETHGERSAELLLRKMIANLALPVFDDAESLIAAVESAQCDAGIAPLAAVAGYLSNNAGTRLQSVTPSATNGGAQVDILAAGVTRHAGNPDGAIRFLSWLTTGEAQRILAESCIALPAVPGAAVPQQFASWRALSQSEIGISRLGMLGQDAIDLAERARYD